MLFDDMDRGVPTKELVAEESFFLMYIHKDGLDDKAKKKKV